MSTPELVIRSAVAFVVGVIISAAISVAISIFAPRAAIISFILLSIMWFVGAAQIFVRGAKAEGGKLGKLPDPEHWIPEQLPIEFRFITRRTTLKQLTEKLGPSCPIAGNSGQHALLYNLPSGSVVVITTEDAANYMSRVRSIQLYSSKQDVPLMA